MSAFAYAIQQKGAPLTTCIGFIDGTVRQIAHPVVNQQIMYSGHKRVHCIKFQVSVGIYFVIKIILCPHVVNYNTKWTNSSSVWSCGGP